jgi:hypothetical protein
MNPEIIGIITDTVFIIGACTATMLCLAYIINHNAPSEKNDTDEKN